MALALSCVSGDTIWELGRSLHISVMNSEGSWVPLESVESLTENSSGLRRDLGVIPPGTWRDKLFQQHYILGTGAHDWHSHLLLEKVFSQEGEGLCTLRFRLSPFLATEVSMCPPLWMLNYDTNLHISTNPTKYPFQMPVMSLGPPSTSDHIPRIPPTPSSSSSVMLEYGLENWGCFHGLNGTRKDG